MENDNCVGIRCGNCLDQRILTVRQTHMLPVIALGFKDVRQPGKYHSHLCRLCRCHSLCDQIVPDHIVRGLIALGIGDRIILCHFQRRFHLVAVDVRAAAALEPGRLRKFSDKRCRNRLVQRQDVIFIFQQHHALGCDLPCQFMVCVPVEHSARPSAVQIALDDAQDACDGSVQDRFRQSAAAHCLDDLCITHTAGRGHFQIHACLQVCHTVVDCAPVADHIAVEIPLAPENIRERLFVLSGIDAVDPVIGAHHRPGLCLADGTLKRRQIDLPCGALAHLRRTAHAAVFLVVGIKVFDAGPHILALYATDEIGRHFAGNIRVFGVVFEVSAAERRTLDVDRRSQQHAHIFRLALVAQRLAHAFHQFPVKGRGCGAAGRKAYSFDAVVYAHVVALFILLAQSVRAVAHHHGRDAQALHRLGVPEVAAGTETGFFFQRQLLQ